MPVHLPPITRRAFVTSLGAAFLSFPLSRLTAAESARIDEDLVAILNDTHIGEKQKPDSAVPSNLRATVEYLVRLEKRPAAVFINGDLALHDGQPGDYRFLAQLLQPLREARVTVHLTLGNHDNREVFYDVLSGEKPSSPVVVSKHISVVQTPRANFFLLDSLKETMVTQGELGAEQLAWLGKALDAHADKPAVLLAHHNPRLGGAPEHFPGGLIDSQPLWDLLTSRRHVKAYVHGHIHDWGLASHGGVHIANTPATSYVANRQTSTTGWIIARLRNDGVTLTTHTHIAEHPWNRKAHELAWRV